MFILSDVKFKNEDYKSLKSTEEDKGLKFTEEDYKYGIEEYIELAKRKMPKGTTDAFVYKIEIQYPYIYESGVGFDEEEVCIGNYSVSIENLKGIVWKEGYEIKLPMYRGKFRDYKNNVKISDDREESLLFDCTKYPFTYYLESKQNEKLEECIDDWVYISKDIIRHTIKSAKQHDREIFQSAESCLYIKLSKNLYLILDDSVKNAKLVKEWKIIENEVIKRNDR